MPKICFGHHLVPTCKFFPTSHIFSSNFLGPTTFFPKMQTFSTENLGPTNFFPKMQIFSIENLGPTYIPTLKNHRNSADGCRLQYQSFRGINTIKFSVSYWIRDNFMLFLVIDCVFLSQCSNQRENTPQHNFSLSQDDLFWNHSHHCWGRDCIKYRLCDLSLNMVFLNLKLVPIVKPTVIPLPFMMTDECFCWDSGIGGTSV